jgi:hypothetical protein
MLSSCGPTKRMPAAVDPDRLEQLLEPFALGFSPAIESGRSVHCGVVFAVAADQAARGDGGWERADAGTSLTLA